MASYALYPNPPFFALNKTVIQKIFQYSQVSNSPNCVEILKIGWLYIGVIISYAAIHRYTDRLVLMIKSLVLRIRSL